MTEESPIQPVPDKNQEKIDLEKNKLLEMSQVSLWLDTYDDIFSDFDPRPFSDRAISDDFLLEAKKFFREKKTGGLELKFLIPEKERKQEIETQIKKRLKEYFKKHCSLLQKELGGTKKRATALTLSGIILMILASALDYFQSKILILHLATTLLELGGWLAVWFGLEQIFYTIRGKNQEVEFYKKMSQLEISFLSY